MGYCAHVHTKHEIEYGGTYFGWQSAAIKDWLVDNNVDVLGDSDNDYDHGPEWELDKDQLRKIPESAYCDIGPDGEITADRLRGFVRECINAPTGEFAYVSWF